MTRLAILSDIHGNLPAFEAVIADMAAFAPDHVIVAGDLINMAPFSAEVLERVFALGWSAIRGNHEYYLLEYGTDREPEARRNWDSIGALYEQLQGRWYNTIAALPDELTLYYGDAPPIRVVHGVPGDPFTAIDRLSDEERASDLLGGVNEPTVVAGHYHLSFEKQLNGWQVLNAGSLGVPMDGYQDASYLILDSTDSGWQPTFRRVPVNYAPLFAEFERQRFVEQFGVIGHVMVAQFRYARPVIAAYAAWLKAHDPGAAWTIETFDTYVNSDDAWDYIPAIYQYNQHLGITPQPCSLSDNGTG